MYVDKIPSISMEKLHFFFFNMIFLVFLLQFTFLTADTPPNNYLFINCGSKSTVNADDRSFVGDVINNSGHSFAVGKSKSIQEHPNSSTSTDTAPLYQTARVFKQRSSYEFDVTEKGTYMVRLHFYVFKSKKIDLGDAQFNVSASGISLLSNFRILKNTSSLPVIKEFLLTVNVGKFRINFIPAQEKSFAYINAIEVLLTHRNYGLASSDDSLPQVSSKGRNGTYHTLLPWVLKTIQRINIGGSFLDASNETVLWRNWISDEKNLLPGSSVKTCNPPATGFPLRLDEEDALYYAPKLVYLTCRELKLNDGPGSNVSSWRFAVNKNARHLVRVHFCDFLTEASNVNNFSFFIYNSFNQTINPYNMNITSPGVPFYYDFVVDSDDSGFLNISISPQDLEDSMSKIAYLNGVEIMEFLKERGMELGSLPVQGTQNKKRLLIGSIGGVAIVFISIMGFFWGRKCWKAKQVEKNLVSQAMPSYEDGRTVHASPAINFNLKLKIPFSEILEATQNFNNKFLIGEGGFGKVYKGILKSGVKVAVKRSDSKHGQGLPEFQTEVLLLSRIRHRNLVSLIGYCNEGSEMILVYEFMAKGALRDHLYSLNEYDNSEKSMTQPKLSWSQRLQICIGSAQGLHYLHSGSDGGITHRDVKSTNILLDENYVAKVADFGLSRSSPLEGDSFSMGIKGSFGYLDPEYFKTLQFTDKSDVYSFGVVLLEVLCARPAIATTTQMKEINLADWGLFWLNKGQIEEIVDPFLLGKINPNSLRKFGEIVEKCLKQNGDDRPTMRDVYWDLIYALQLQQTPVQANPFDDSTKDTSIELEFLPDWYLHSNNFPADREEVTMSVEVDETSYKTSRKSFS
ncbi:hypothetical protein EZV62_013930 [Acer yangbiense]|uniref:Protein kinase domain-containing protein n=1 Tax=Acer yangbiense TaxID=1000413 RepID=A0A5C7HQM1_9ROSI|nr:hypothetical protein EZV62_013930 [Acer yangbiense]